MSFTIEFTSFGHLYCPMIVRAPGEVFGPCKDQCEHEACANQREYAESTFCRVCGGRIGYDRQFTPIVYLDENEYAHTSCCGIRDDERVFETFSFEPKGEVNDQ